MCLLLYLGADRELPITEESNADQPGFRVSVVVDVIPGIRQLLNSPYVYYVGSHEGCGCGFGYISTEEYNQGLEDLRQAQKEGMPDEYVVQYQQDRERRITCMNALRAYLTAVTQTGSVKLLVTWADDLSGEILRLTVTPEYFGGDRCILHELHLFEITHS